jgi:HPt (histidine-containing phosphotransfer) domain-containing protein
MTALFYTLGPCASCLPASPDWETAPYSPDGPRHLRPTALVVDAAYESQAADSTLPRIVIAQTSDPADPHALAARVRDWLIRHDVEQALSRLRRIGKADFVGRMVHLASAGIDEHLAAMLAADPVAARLSICQHAHAIKSSAGNLGARIVQRLASEIEQSRDWPSASVEAKLAQLQQAWAMVKPLLAAANMESAT